MKPVLPGDLIAAGRALLAAPPSGRRALALQLVQEAQTAARHVADTGRVHATYGNGTLMTVALRRPLLPERSYDDPDYAECLIDVLTAVSGQAVTTVNRTRKTRNEQL